LYTIDTWLSDIWTKAICQEIDDFLVMFGKGQHLPVRIEGVSSFSGKKKIKKKALVSFF